MLLTFSWSCLWCFKMSFRIIVFGTFLYEFFYQFYKVKVLWAVNYTRWNCDIVRLTWLLFAVQDIVHDSDTQSEDWYIALEALLEVIFSILAAFILSDCFFYCLFIQLFIFFCLDLVNLIACHSTLWSQVLPSLQPLIIYFPDSSEWLSRAVPKSHRKEFIHKVEKMFDQLQGPVVLICGQNIIETSAKEKEKFVSFLLRIRWRNIYQLSMVSLWMHLFVKCSWFCPLPSDDTVLHCRQWCSLILVDWLWYVLVTYVV